MLLDQSLFEKLLSAAANHPRRRSFLNLHQSYAEPVQRMLCAIQPDSYIVPHQHQQQWELFVVLAGRIDLLLFAASGVLLERKNLTAGSTLCGVELAAGQWHSLVAATEGAVILEVKQGPFDPTQPRSFAPFAPVEGTIEAADFQYWMQGAVPGQQFQADINEVCV